jgi:glycosyltransferase involved in cell wall biosynthesis
MGPPLTPPAARVALCLPTRNRAGYLRQAIESALNQTYRDFSLLVSDNASTDNTPDVVASIDDRRLSYVRLERDVGWCGNFNNCLDCAPAGAEYAIILGDDDLLHPRFLERTVEVLDREASTAFVHTGFDLVDGGGRLLRGGVNWMRTTAQDILEPGMTFIRHSMLWSTRVCASATLIRLAALPGVRFDEVDVPASDLGLWLRIALDWDVAFLAEPLASYRVHADNDSATWGMVVDGAYSPDNFEFVERIANVKRRFLAAHGNQLDDPSGLRRLVEKSARRELVNVTRNLTRPKRPVGKTLSLLWQAGRLDPRLAVEPGAWRLVGASLLGPRAIARMRTR